MLRGCDMSPMQQEVTKLRDQLAVALNTIADMRKTQADEFEPLIGVARLSKSEANIVSLVLKHGRITYQRIYSTLYDHYDEPRANSTMKVLICRARQKLKPHGIAIESVWGVGLSMSDDCRNALRHLAGLPVIESPSVCPLELGQVAA